MNTGITSSRKLTGAYGVDRALAGSTTACPFMTSALPRIAARAKQNSPLARTEVMELLPVVRAAPALVEVFPIAKAEPPGPWLALLRRARLSARWSERAAGRQSATPRRTQHPERWARRLSLAWRCKTG